MKNFWSFFVEKYKFTFILTVAIVLFGIFAVIQLPKESQPEVNIPIASVRTIFTGASAVDVEQLVTDPIEDEISSLNGVKEYTSTSREGVSSVTVEFNENVDKSEVIDDLEKRMDQVTAEMPSDAKDPSVEEIDLNNQPFMQVSLGGPFSIVELTNFADQIKSELEKISGISSVTVVGDQEKELEVIVDESQLQQYSLSISEVTQAISDSDSDIPIGEIETSGQRFSLRLEGQLNNVEQIKEVPIKATEDSVIQVQDVAEVKSKVGDMDTLSRLSADNKESERAITFLIYDTTDGDVTRASQQVKETLSKTVKEDFPTALEYIVVDDMGDRILQDLNTLTRNGIATAVIVFLVLFIALGLREAAIASVALPLSFLMTFSFINYIGLTLNFMTLFSLILALGIIVDTAIVINEGINANINSGDEPFEAAKSAIEEFQWPLIAGVMTTVFAFVPMLLTGGIIGEFIKSIPITVSGVLVSSLFVALALITTFSAVLGTYQKEKDKYQKESRIDKITANIKNKYEKYLQDLITSDQKKKKLGIAVIVLLIFSYSLPALGILNVNMFPPANESKFTIEATKPIGTTIEDTSKAAEKIEAELQKDSRIASYVVNIGTSLGSTGFGSPNQVNITVNLSEKGQQEGSTNVTDEYQDKLSDLPRTEVSVTQPSSGPQQQAPVVITVIGDDLDTLDNIAKKFETELEKTEGTKNTGSSVKDTNGEFVINLDRVKAKQMGISTQQLARTLRNRISGSTPASITIDGDDTDVVVKSKLNQNQISTDIDQTDIETLRSLQITTPQGSVSLSSIAQIKLQNNRIEINHKDGQRIAKATSYTKAETSPSEVFSKIRKKIDSGEIEMPQGYSAELGGENEDIQKSFMDMMQAMVLAIFLIASLMILQFESFKQAFLILTTIPLALIGVFPGLALLNLPLSFPGIIGIVALVGIVVNNAILLIDTINRYMKKHQSVKAIIKAGKERLRPILLTTFTTVLGILPLAITEEVWRSLGFAIIFGLLFSTVLTLVIVPVLYEKFIVKK